MTADLEFARELVAMGVPVWAGPYHRDGWESMTADQSNVDDWRPGWYLAAVTGHALDVIDVDVDHAGYGDGLATRDALRAAGAMPYSYATVRTPRGGVHEYVAPLRSGKFKMPEHGIDVQAGGPDGSRGLAYLAKPGGTYVVEGNRLAEFDGELDGDEFLSWCMAHRKRLAPVTGADPFDSKDYLASVPAGSHDDRGAAYAMRLVRRQLSDPEIRLFLRAYVAQTMVVDPRRPFTDTDFDRWISGARHKVEPMHVVDEVSESGTLEPADWATILASGAVEPKASLLGLFYPGLVHDFHGESESGKSFLAQYLAARITGDGGAVLYLDFESSALTVGRRMRDQGANMALVEYYAVDRAPTAGQMALLSDRTRAFVVIDGVTDAMGLYGLDPNLNKDVGYFHREVTRPLAARTGGAVLLIDHVSKSTEFRGRFAIGAQHKMSALDGASYLVDVVEPLRPGAVGTLDLRVAKDRNGDVRSRAGVAGPDRTQPVHVVSVDSTNPLGPPVFTLGAPGDVDAKVIGQRQRVYSHVKEAPGCKTMDIYTAVGDAGRNWAPAALDWLVEGDYVVRTKVGNGQAHRVSRDAVYVGYAHQSSELRTT